MGYPAAENAASPERRDNARQCAPDHRRNPQVRRHDPGSAYLFLRLSALECLISLADGIVTALQACGVLGGRVAPRG